MSGFDLRAVAQARRIGASHAHPAPGGAQDHEADEESREEEGVGAMGGIPRGDCGEGKRHS